jgi:hypothetical protein
MWAVHLEPHRRVVWVAISGKPSMPVFLSLSVQLVILHPPTLSLEGEGLARALGNKLRVRAGTTWVGCCHIQHYNRFVLASLVFYAAPMSSTMPSVRQIREAVLTPENNLSDVF